MKMPEMTRGDFVHLGADTAIAGAVAKARPLDPPLLCAQALPDEHRIFGHNAAIGCRLANQSSFHRSIATWDAQSRTIKV